MSESGNLNNFGSFGSMNQDDPMMKHWESFTSNPNPDDFGKLWDGLKPTVEHAMNKYGLRSTNVPKQAVEGQAIVEFDKALKSYKPQSGAALKSWVFGRMRALQRYMREEQDIAHIPDNRAVEIGRLRERTTFLTDQLGREPSTEELSDDLHIPIKKLGQLQKELRRDYMAEEGLDAFSDVDDMSELEDRVRSIQMDLSGDQQVILEHVMGLFGKPRLTISQIAKKLNKTENQVRGEKNKIIKMWEKAFPVGQ
jgi:DNA-directed RNA polymerase specialized sigma subunit